MASKNKVSVLITSYNKSQSLKQAIESVLEQKTSFEYEIIIVDDGSTDNSIDIIKSYSDKRIRMFLENHKGMMETYLSGFAKCNGEYIAFCECDDYWIDCYKLQKQVTYMDSNRDCGLCITKVYVEKNKKKIPMSKGADDINENMSFDSMLKGKAYIYAQSYLLRKSDFIKYIDFDEEVMKFHLWDYPIVLELIKHTKFHCLDFYSAVFVKKIESVSNTKGRLKRAKYLSGLYKIKIYFILKYGCKKSTILYLIYRIVRDIYSLLFLRWNE